MRIGVIGYTSKIGKPLIERGCIPLECNVTMPNSIDRVLARDKPEIVVNLASKSDPDYCEANYEEAYNVNIVGAKNVFYAAHQRNIPVVALSTDHIFSGRSYFDWKMMQWISKGPYKESYSRPLPVNGYGILKLGMETIADMYPNVKVVRTSYCFDYERLYTDIKLIKEGFPVSFPSFIYRSFMHTYDFVKNFMLYLEKFYEMPHLLHISGSKTVSWYDFMCVVADAYGLNKGNITKRTKGDINYAPRPHKCGLDTSLSAKLGFHQYDYLSGIKLMAE